MFSDLPSEYVVARKYLVPSVAAYRFLRYVLIILLYLFNSYVYISDSIRDLFDH